MKRPTIAWFGLFAIAGAMLLAGCGNAPSTPIAPDQPKADPGPPPNMDQLMQGARDRGTKH